MAGKCKLPSRNLAAHPLVSLSELGPRIRLRFGTCASCNLRVSLLSLQRLFVVSLENKEGEEDVLIWRRRRMIWSSLEVAEEAPPTR